MQNTFKPGPCRVCGRNASGKVTMQAELYPRHENKPTQWVTVPVHSSCLQSLIDFYNNGGRALS